MAARRVKLVVMAALLAAAVTYSIASRGAPALNYEFFKLRVQPIFLQKRDGHTRCYVCHAESNNAFRLERLSPSASTWNEEQSRKNFEIMARVVKAGSPQSKLLVHPLAEAAGGDFYHNGGKHWSSQNDAEWQTLKAWILGQPAK